MLWNQLAKVYLMEGQYRKAEELLAKVIHVWETVLGPEHPDMAAALNNLGTAVPLH
jgi:hypothetical protein